MRIGSCKPFHIRIADREPLPVNRHISINPERVSDDADDALEDDVDADEMHAKYPTLVGYLERRSTASPASQPTAEPNAPAPADADANLSRPDEGRF